MPTEIVVPRLGWSMDEGTFAGWLIEPGVQVNVGDNLFLLEGEKATQDVESFDGGLLCIPPDAPQPGDTVQVGQVIGYLLTADESAPQRIASESSASAAPPATSPASTPPPMPSPPEPPATQPDAAPADASNSAGPAVRRLARELGIDIQTIHGSGPRGRVLPDDLRRAALPTEPAPPTRRRPSSPRARRYAREHGISLEAVTGTGRNGRIRERDVRAAQSTSAQSTSARTPGKLRQIIAKRMLAGVHEAAPVTLHRKVNAAHLKDCRQQFQQTPLEGLVPTVNDCILRLTAAALVEHPEVNALWQNDQLHPSSDVHLAFGVDTPAGLLAPVIHNAQQQDLASLAQTARTLIDAARQGTTRENDLQGGTFTVTNLGGLGIDSFTPILNLPQVAILGVGRIVAEPIVQQGAIVAGQTMQLSLTFDHRALDGATAARFLQTLTALIESPHALLNERAPSLSRPSA